MKNNSLFKNNSSWLTSLLVISVFSLLLFILSSLVLGFDIAYTNESKNNGNNIGTSNVAFKYDVIIFPVVSILALFELVISVYCMFNIPMWLKSRSSSIDSRKKFNTVFLMIIMPLLIVLSIDAVIRLFYVSIYFADYLKVNDSSKEALAAINFNDYGIFGTFNKTGDKGIYKYGNFGFNTIILLVTSLILSIHSIVYWFLQKKLFKSEQHENSRDDVRSHYRNLEKEKLRKELTKTKQKDLSSTVRLF